MVWNIFQTIAFFFYKRNELQISQTQEKFEKQIIFIALNKF